MNYWPNKSWKICVSSANAKAPTEVARPWALIGSDKACGFRIQNRRVPPVTYAAFAFVDAIEVWPICALAYPHWGKVSPDQRLPIGGAHLQLSFAEPSQVSGHAAENESEYEPEPLSVIEITSRGKSVSLVLNHRVAILGSEHPSTHRIRSAGLRPCDHAIVSVDGQCWLINLKLEPFVSDDDRVQVLKFDSVVQIGDISLSLRTPKKEPIAGQEFDGTMDLLVHADTSLNQHEASEYSHGTIDDILDDERENDDDLPELAANLLKPKSASFASDSEKMTTQVTDRLMKITQSRWSKRRLLKFGLFACLFLAAGATITWFAIRHFLPAIMKLEGYD